LGSTTESLTLYGLNHPTEGGLNWSNSKFKYQSLFFKEFLIVSTKNTTVKTVTNYVLLDRTKTSNYIPSSKKVKIVKKHNLFLKLGFFVPFFYQCPN
jgi:hypothetical protein